MNHVDSPPVWRHACVAAGRAIEIAAICAAHLVGWTIRHAVFWRGSDARAWPVRLTRLLEDLGPTFIKAGQILSVRPDLTCPSLANTLARLRTNVRPVAASAVVQTIETSFGASVETVFTRFDRIPVASGSIAQVHRAVMRDGRVVAVKVRRPGTVRRVNADFAVLRAIARLVARLPLFHSLPVCDLVEEIARPVEQQLDFRLEAQNHRTLRREFEHTERLSIPALVDHLCTDCVLTMAYVEGLHDCTAERWPEDERRAAGLTALRVLYRMIFEIGLVHADMHPGNVFLQRNGKVALLDMGLVAKLSPADRHDFVDFFFGLVTDRGDECARIVVQGASALGARYDPVQFVSAMRGLVSRHARRRSRDFEIATFVSELLALQRRFDVRGSTAFITTVLAMVVYDGVCKQLYPDCDFQAEARGFLILARYGRADLDVPRAG